MLLQTQGQGPAKVRKKSASHSSAGLSRIWVVVVLWICISIATDGKGLLQSGSQGPVPAVSNCQSSLSLGAQGEEDGLGPVIWEWQWLLLGKCHHSSKCKLVKGPCYPVSKHMLLCMALVTSLPPSGDPHLGTT